ncbi:MAG: low specificity L-threonine aldolase [Sphingobium sp.]|nr:low specificity L-threonine aldolase [Sphingobium sp.]
MRFFSDNAATVCAPVMAAIESANSVDTAYDGDALSKSLDAAFSALFEHEVAVIWTGTGTSANALALAALCPPFGAIFCHDEAHVMMDECGAVEFYTGGARLMGCAGEGAKLTPEVLAARHDAIRPDVHRMQPHAVTITNATEYGLAYTPAEVAAIGAFCRERKLRLHMDGARFANAVAHLGCSPADVTWRGGVDALSFGFTKNGAMNAEALVLFDPELAENIRIRRKRAGHLLSKGRFVAAQLLAMLSGNIWLENARSANAAARILADSAASRLLHVVEANELFIRLSAAEAAGLRAQGFDFYDWGDGAARLVTSWNHTESDVAPLAAAIAAL